MHALLADDQIAVTIVAVHEHGRDRRRQVLAKPAERELEDRSRRFLRVVLRVQMLHLSLRVQQRQVRKARDIDRMNRSRDLSELARKPRAHRCEHRVAQNLAGQGRAGDPLHQKSFAQFIFWSEYVAHFRHRHAAAVDCGQHLCFRLQREHARSATDSRPPQDERLCARIADRVERPRFVGRARR
jgi:hypothetical protein